MHVRQLCTHSAIPATAAILLALSAGGCFESAKDPDANTTPDATKVQYALKLAEGRSYYVRVVFDEDIVGQAGKRKLSAQRSTGLGYTFDVNSVDEQANALVDCTVSWVRYKQKVTGGTPANQDVDYDSSDENKQTIPRIKGPGDPLGDIAFWYARFVRALLHEKFTLKITPRGRVQEMRGLKEIRNNIAEKLGRKDLALQDVNDFKEYFVRQLPFLTPLEIYPERAVAIGESWTRTEELAHQQNEHTWTLKNRQDGAATIEVDTIITFEKPPTQVPEFPYSARSHGRIVIDEATGRILRSKTRQEFLAETGRRSTVATFEMTDPQARADE